MSLFLREIRGKQFSFKQWKPTWKVARFQKVERFPGGKYAFTQGTKLTFDIAVTATTGCNANKGLLRGKWQADTSLCRKCDKQSSLFVTVDRCRKRAHAYTFSYHGFRHRCTKTPGIQGLTMQWCQTKVMDCLQGTATLKNIINKPSTQHTSQYSARFNTCRKRLLRHEINLRDIDFQTTS